MLLQASFLKETSLAYELTLTKPDPQHNSEFKQATYTKEQKGVGHARVCVDVYMYTYPDIRLSCDGFPLVQVNHLWGSI